MFCKIHTHARCLIHRDEWWIIYKLRAFFSVFLFLFNVNSIRYWECNPKTMSRNKENCVSPRGDVKRALDISRETDAISRHDETARFLMRKRRRSGRSRRGRRRRHLEVAALPRHRSYGCSKISRCAAAMPAHIRVLQIPRKTPTTTFILELQIHGDVAHLFAGVSRELSRELH